MAYVLEYSENRKKVRSKRTYPLLDDARRAAITIIKKSGNRKTVHIVYGGLDSTVGQVDAYDNFEDSIVYGYIRWSDGDPKIWKISPTTGGLVKNLGTLDYSWD